MYQIPFPLSQQLEALVQLLEEKTQGFGDLEHSAQAQLEHILKASLKHIHETSLTRPCERCSKWSY